MAEVLHPEWRDANDSTRYPFAASAPLRNRDGAVILDGTFLDAAIYPAGSSGGFYLSRVRAAASLVTLWVGDAGDPALASGSYAPSSGPSEIRLTDPDGRPAGVLVTDPARLAALSAVGGDHRFQPADTPFVASVGFPCPPAGVEAFVLPDGSVLAGEVYLVGGEGVALTADDGETLERPSPCAAAVARRAVSVHAVGDPLFRRLLCEPAGLDPPRFVKRVRFVYGDREFVCEPPDGVVRLFSGHDAAVDTVLRVTARDGALWVGIAGRGSS